MNLAQAAILLCLLGIPGVHDKKIKRPGSTSSKPSIGKTLSRNKGTIAKAAIGLGGAYLAYKGVKAITKGTAKFFWGDYGRDYWMGSQYYPGVRPGYRKCVEPTSPLEGGLSNLFYEGSNARVTEVIYECPISQQCCNLDCCNVEATVAIRWWYILIPLAIVALLICCGIAAFFYFCKQGATLLSAFRGRADPPPEEYQMQYPPPQQPAYGYPPQPGYPQQPPPPAYGYDKPYKQNY